MTFVHSPYSGPKEIKYLFIDGGCLHQIISDTSESYFNGRNVDIDYSVFTRNFNKTFYYDALPPRKNDESDEEYENRKNQKINFFNHLRSINGYHVYEGVSRRRRRVVEQKEVDILIAVDMLTHSFRRNMHQVAFLTSDLDFRPLIESIVREGMYISLWYPQAKTNKELVYAADSRMPLTIRNVFNWCTQNFRNQNPIPNATEHPGKNVDGLRLVETWNPEYGPESEIYEFENQYKLVFPSIRNTHQNQHISVVYSHIDVLKKYTQEVFREFWKNPI